MQHNWQAEQKHQLSSEVEQRVTKSPKKLKKLQQKWCVKNAGEILTKIRNKIGIKTRTTQQKHEVQRIKKITAFFIVFSTSWDHTRVILIFLMWTVLSRRRFCPGSVLVLACLILLHIVCLESVSKPGYPCLPLPCPFPMWSRIHMIILWWVNTIIKGRKKTS